MRTLVLLLTMLVATGCTLSGAGSSCKVEAEKCDHCELTCDHNNAKAGGVPPPI
jgi:hypothetical protein